MSRNDLDSTDEATLLIGEAIRRVMMGEVKDAPAELMQIAQSVMSKIVPAVLTREEFNRVEAETGIYPPTFRANHGDKIKG